MKALCALAGCQSNNNTPSGFDAAVTACIYGQLFPNIYL
jgi:hypothetical protein